LRCRARECPNNWSVSDGNLCSAHAFKEPKEWNAITDRELQIFAAKQKAPTVQFRPVDIMTTAQKQSIIKNLMNVLKTTGSTDYKEWAIRLKSREQSGERLNSIQRAAWREALRETL